MPGIESHTDCRAGIFILEGLATLIVGGVSFWLVHDFPDDAKFLSPEDRARVLRRLKADAQSSAEHEEFKMSYFWASVKDWKTYMFAIIYMGCDGALYAFSLFIPTIINQLVSPDGPKLSHVFDSNHKTRAMPAPQPTFSPCHPTPPRPF